MSEAAQRGPGGTEGHRQGRGGEGGEGRLRDLELRLEVEGEVALLLLHVLELGPKRRLARPARLEQRLVLVLVAHELLVERRLEAPLLPEREQPPLPLGEPLGHLTQQPFLLRGARPDGLRRGELAFERGAQLGEPYCLLLLVVRALGLELPREQHRVLVLHRLVCLLEAALLHLHCRAVELRGAAHAARAAHAAHARAPTALPRVGQLDELAVHLVLYEAVHVVISGVVPHALRLQLHGEVVAGLLVVQ